MTEQKNCLICGEAFFPEGETSVCTRCRRRYGKVAGVSANEETSRLLAALYQIERRQHSETRKKLAKAEHDRDRYARHIRWLRSGIEGLANKAAKLTCPPL